MKYTHKSVRSLAATLITFGSLAGIANAASYTDVQLASGNPVTSDGLTLTTSTAGGSIDFITAGEFTGLWLGKSNTAGLYTFTLSQPISSIEFEFDAFSNDSGIGGETLSDFSTNLGSAGITYTNQANTFFDGTTITVEAGIENGQGIISYSSGVPFTSFSFYHDQGPDKNGLVVERMVITVVPEPSSTLLLGCSALGFLALRRRNK